MKSRTKKAVVSLSSAGVLILMALLFLGTRWCYQHSFCDRYSELFLQDGVEIFLVFSLVLLFSLITYWMKEEVFQVWFKFARWYVPFMIIGYLIYPGRGAGSHSFGAGGAMADGFNAMIYIIVVSIFMVVSVKRIVRATRLSRSDITSH